MIREFKSIINFGNKNGKEIYSPSPLEINSFISDIMKLKNLFNLGSNGISKSIN